MIQIAIILLCVLSFLFYKYLQSRRDYWSKRGVVFHVSDNFLGILGLSWDFIIDKRAFFEHVTDIYNKHPNEPAVGTFTFATPTIVLRDLDNIKTVMTGDFNTFNDRAFNINRKIDKLADNILTQNGIRWKLIRQKMTPLFTSTKLRNMYYIMDKSGHDFIKYLNTKPKGNAFDILTRFCSAAISASVFGIGTESTMDSPFLDMARKAVEPSAAFTFRISINSLSPKFMELFNIRLFGDFEDFFIGAIKQVLRTREQQSVRTHDFADLCVSLQKNGTLRDPATGYEIEPTDELMAAQAFFFFVAGVEPCATVMFFTLFELAKHPEILNKLHEEIDAVFEQCDNNPTYEAVTEMKYLSMVMDEAMRMHPPIGNINRRCTQDGGVLPVGKIPIEKGTLIQLPFYALHHDPQYFPEPEKFIPERFNEEGRKNIKNYSYMPFGEGHRICLGMRYALLQVKTGLVHFLHNFSVKTQDADKKIKYGKLPVQVRPTNIDLQFIPRTCN